MNVSGLMACFLYNRHHDGITLIKKAKQNGNKRKTRGKGKRISAKIGYYSTFCPFVSIELLKCDIFLLEKSTVATV